MPRSSTPPPTFPYYLIPNFFTARRRSSTSTTTTTATNQSATPPSTSPPSRPTSYISRTPTSHLRCTKCLADLVPVSNIISKGFNGRHGRAYLVSASPPSAIGLTGSDVVGVGDLPNTTTHKPVPRQLVTGAHTVSDISCRVCRSVLGWKYVDAEEESQKYKVGKFILETKRVVKEVGWDGEHEFDPGMCMGTGMAGRGDEEVEFDSQDEDECEDLFSGLWSPELAKARRRNRSSDANGADLVSG
ncbi:yippee-domain-containing protein [Westerdykella ornata]|uniref:Yippee-domain-containing protein n=1 Tax=Westerdykella ornata TaxID=318751 RepID=A0A6A6J9C0_WESOR|nr:yippee-domain-containing protein [Westerdykella ornata]KAF2272236.1 yippee-domain-containing protein [Westerdykella ornata]